MTSNSHVLDAIVVGGGQAGLAAGYYLKQAEQSFIILEAQDQAVGSWPHYYDSLKLFSPRRYSGLPGLEFPGPPDGFPARDEVIDFLQDYQRKHQLPIQTQTRVERVESPNGLFQVTSSGGGTLTCKNLIVASGPHNHPWLPTYPAADQFQGQIVHSYNYVNPTTLGIIKDADKRRNVIVVGSKNSAVQIAYELAKVCQVTLASREKVRFVRQSTCGKNIYWWERKLGLARIPLGLSQQLSASIMRMGGVIDDGTYRQAMQNGTLIRREMFERFYDRGVQWPNGDRQKVDAVVFATGYLPSVAYLKDIAGALGDSGQPIHRMGISPIQGLYYMGLVGMRNIASATLRGVDADAKAIVRHLSKRTAR